MWAGHATGNVKPGVGVTYKFILTQREGAPPSSPSSPPPPPAPSPPPPVPSPPPSPGLPPGVSAPPLGDTHVSFVFFCVACLACSCLLLPFSVFASFLLRTHQNHLPPCEVFFYFCMPFFSVLALLFAPFCVFPPVLFGLIKTNPPGSFCLLVLFCSVFPRFVLCERSRRFDSGVFIQSAAPPFPHISGAVFPTCQIPILLSRVFLSHSIRRFSFDFIVLPISVCAHRSGRGRSLGTPPGRGSRS